MMNKRILISAITAAALGGLFVGCGSSDSTVAATGTTISGLGEKSALNGAKVKIGGGSATTDEKGEFRVKNATGTEMVMTGGTFEESNGTAFTTRTNELPLKATTVGNPTGNVNMLTTMVEEFVAKDGTSRAAAVAAVKSIFGLSNEDDNSIYGAVNDGSGNRKENLGRMIHQAMVDVKDSEAASSTVISTFKAGGIAAAAAGTDMNDSAVGVVFTNVYTQVAALDDAPTFTIPQTEIVNFINEIALPPAAFSAGIADGNATTALNSKVKYSNVIVLEQNMIESANFDHAYISRLDLNGTATVNDGESNNTVDLIVSLSNLATSGVNANASYAIKLSNLTAVSDGTDVTNFAFSNGNTTLTITANSNMSDAITYSGSDVNVTEFLNTCNFISADTGTGTGIDLNITAFRNYIGSVIAENGTGSADGNFTSGMNAGHPSEYSLTTLVNINDQKMTLNEQYNLAPRGSILVGEDTTTGKAGTLETGYKVIDADITE